MPEQYAGRQLLPVSYRQGKDGKWYFNVRAANGEIVAQSEGYEKLESAQHGVRVLRDLLNSRSLTQFNLEADTKDHE
jgi:uncharacterized protein YegP (UPF0339 family)